MDTKATPPEPLQPPAQGEKTAKKYISKILKFMLSNPQDLMRLQALGDISFSKHVKGKIDADILRKENEVGVSVLQEQILQLQKENAELKNHVAAPEIVRPKVDNGNRGTLSVADWFED